MNTDFYLTELFDRYLDNDLNLVERQEFEQRLASDRMFAQQFRLHKEIDKALIQDDVLDFRMKLKLIGVNNQDLVQTPPMVISEELKPEIDQAILEQDIMALRDQLNRIHASVVEEVDHHEIEGYSGIERAIVNQDSMALNEGLVAFGEFMQSDEFLSESDKAELSREVDKAIVQEDVMQLRSTLDGYGRKAIGSRKVIPLQRKTITYISSAAAAIFILVFAGNMFLKQNFGSYSPERLANKYFTAYDGISEKRGASDDNKLYDLGLQKYNKGDYTNALEWFEAYIDELKDATPEVVQLFTGVSAYMIKDYDKAITHLTTLGPGTMLHNQAEWYTAGCYIQKSEYDKAKEILKRISEDPGKDYHDQSLALLKDLQNR